MTPVPNFFIVGAPKCGTSSLREMLMQSPDVFMTQKQGPGFFSHDLPVPYAPKSWEKYLEQYDACKDEKRIGEATAEYMVSKVAATEIKRYAPDAKIIVMLRNPVDMVPSLHAQRLKEGNENIRRLEDALDAESERRQGRRLPIQFNRPKEFLLYREFAKYSEQLERYFTAFGQENVHVIIFDDFCQDTERELRKVCEFLGIAWDYERECAIVNPAQVPRSQWIVALLKISSGTAARRVASCCPIRLKKVILHIISSVKRMNLRKGRPTVTDETRKNLVSYYRKEIDDLEVILDRDLGAWRTSDRGE